MYNFLLPLCGEIKITIYKPEDVACVEYLVQHGRRAVLDGAQYDVVVGVAMVVRPRQQPDHRLAQELGVLVRAFRLELDVLLQTAPRHHVVHDRAVHRQQTIRLLRTLHLQVSS